MWCCRICRSEKNLKYSPKELRQEIKKQRVDRQQLIKNASNIGNICFDCDHRLQTYHQIQDSDNEEVDVDGSVLTTPEEKNESSIVDDKTFLYTKIVRDIKKSQKRKSEMNIVEVVDLSMESENEKENQEISKLEKNVNSCNKKESQQEELNIFHKNLNRRKRKRYNESAFRLLASFSLVSSESESDDYIDAFHKKSSITNIVPTTDTLSCPSHFAETKSAKIQNIKKVSICSNEFIKCDQCNLSFPDKDKFEVHNRIHSSNNLNCPACELCFSVPIRLINHMRRKHRSYQCSVLTERPRCSQDSAMTIRLRYQEHDIYYECQLCGRIDDMFKTHKDHVLCEHAVESKSLGDPIIIKKDKSKSNALYCPICKHNCGFKHLEVSKHIISFHRMDEYKSHLREIFNIERYKSVIPQTNKIKKTARVLQFGEMQILFFQCRLCKNIELNSSDHISHSKTHEDHSQAKKKKKKSKVEKKYENYQINTDGFDKISTASGNKMRIKNKALNNETNKAPSIKVKVKQFIRNVRTQKCICKFCGLTCKSFLLLNRHLLQKHRFDEYCICQSCTKSFMERDSLQTHNCLNPSHKQKRKMNKNITEL